MNDLSLNRGMKTIGNDRLTDRLWSSMPSKREQQVFSSMSNKLDRANKRRAQSRNETEQRNRKTWNLGKSYDMAAVCLNLNSK